MARSGAVFFVGLPDNTQPVVADIVIPLATQPVVVALVTGPGPAGKAWVFVSVVTKPAGVITSVCGDSSDADQALSHGPVIEYRTCGMRDGPAIPAGPPKSSVSGSASESRKFDSAWPARKPPSVP